MFTKVWLRDVSERVIASSVLAFVSLLAVGTTINISTVQAAWAAALIGGASAIKGAVAALIGQKGSASLDPGLAVVEVPPGSEVAAVVTVGPTNDGDVL